MGSPEIDSVEHLAKGWIQIGMNTRKKDAKKMIQLEKHYTTCQGSLVELFLALAPLELVFEPPNEDLQLLRDPMDVPVTGSIFQHMRFLSRRH
jgi:hypothetical protein